MDYALLSTLTLDEPTLPKEITVSYDIACQYSKNVARRFSKAFGHELVDLVSQAVFAVPKLHCQGHKDDCQY